MGLPSDRYSDGSFDSLDPINWTQIFDLMGYPHHMPFTKSYKWIIVLFLFRIYCLSRWNSNFYIPRRKLFVEINLGNRCSNIWIYIWWFLLTVFTTLEFHLFLFISLIFLPECLLIKLHLRRIWNPCQKRGLGLLLHKVDLLL